MGRNRGLEGGIWGAVPRCSNFLGCLETPKSFSFPFPRLILWVWDGALPFVFVILRLRQDLCLLPSAPCIWSGLTQDASRCLGSGQASNREALRGHCHPTPVATASTVDRNSSPRVRLDPVPLQCGPGPVTSKCLFLSLLSLAFVK